MAVADGVSSDPNAKQASLAAVKSVMAYTGSNPAEMFWRAHRKVMVLKGPSTTLVTADVTESQIVFASLGDSNAYLYSERDASFRRVFPQSQTNQVFEWIGKWDFPEPAVVTVKTPAGPFWVVVVSDGIDGELDDEAIRSVFSQYSEMGRAAVARRMHELARIAGGEDDITVVAARFWPMKRKMVIGP